MAHSRVDWSGPVLKLYENAQARAVIKKIAAKQYPRLRRLGMEVEDVESDIWVHVFERFSAFRPSRGHELSFLKTVADRFAKSMGRKARARKRGGDVCIHSLSPRSDDEEDASKFGIGEPGERIPRDPLIRAAIAEFQEKQRPEAKALFGLIGEVTFQEAMLLTGLSRRNAEAIREDLRAGLVVGGFEEFAPKPLAECSGLRSKERMHTQAPRASVPKYRFHLLPMVPVPEAQDAIDAALVAIRSTEGVPRTRMDLRFMFDVSRRLLEIDADTEAGQRMSEIFAGMLEHRFGPHAFRVERPGSEGNR